MKATEAVGKTRTAARAPERAHRSSAVSRSVTHKVRTLAATATGAPVRPLFQVGQVYEVPLRRIRENPGNARFIYTVSSIREMVGLIKASGQRTAATGFIDASGDVVLIDGHRRLRACSALGRRTLRVEIRPKPRNEQELYLASRSANKERAEQTPLDDAFVWRGLLERKVFPSQVDLSKRLQVSQSEVSRTLALADLPGALVNTLSEKSELLNLKMLNALREFCKARGEEETQAFILEVCKNGLSYRDVEARRKALASGPQARPRAERHELQFRGATGVLRRFEKDGRIEVSWAGLNPKDAADLAKKLERAFR